MVTIAKARFDPRDERVDRAPEDIEILAPATGLDDAFVVVGDTSSEMFIAWLDEITWVAGRAEVLR